MSDRVVVTGCGSIGMLAAIVAQKAGAEVTVVGTDTDVERRGPLCASLGLRLTTLAPETADLWVEAAGAEAALTTGLHRMSPGGRVVLVGLYGRPISVDLDAVTRREVSVVSSYAGNRDDYATAIDLLTARPELGELLVEVQPITQFARTIGSLGGRSRPKVALRPSPREDA